MRRLSFALMIATLVVSLPASAGANPFANAWQMADSPAIVLAEARPQGILPRGAGPKSVLPQKMRARVGNRQAAARVKQHYPDNKILSVNLIDGGGPPVYRIKVLSTDGVVKFVFVDAINGELFE